MGRWAVPDNSLHAAPHGVGGKTHPGQAPHRLQQWKLRGPLEQARSPAHHTGLISFCGHQQQFLILQVPESCPTLHSS